MPRYPKQDDPKGKKVIPSVTEIISDCTDGTPWAIPYGANQACDWIIENCAKSIDFIGDDCLLVYEEELRRKRKDEKEYPDNARYAHKHHSQKALDIGSKVHGLIEDYLSDEMNGKAPKEFMASSDDNCCLIFSNANTLPTSFPTITDFKYSSMAL